jgi:hypothetical protein
MFPSREPFSLELTLSGSLLATLLCGSVTRGPGERVQWVVLRLDHVSVLKRRYHYNGRPGIILILETRGSGEKK